MKICKFELLKITKCAHIKREHGIILLFFSVLSPHKLCIL